MGLGPLELVLILAVVLIIFGAGRLSELGGAIPKAARNFRAGMNNEDASGPASDKPSPDRAASPRAARGVPEASIARREAQTPVRQPHRFRSLGLLLAGAGLLVFYVDAQYIRLGLPLQAASGVLVVAGVLVFLFL